MRFFLSLFVSVPLAASQAPAANQPQPALSVTGPRALVYTVVPEYSPEARLAGLQGTVRVRLLVTPRGKIADAHIERGLGLGLDQQALKAVRQWVYGDVSHTMRRDELMTLNVPFMLDAAPLAAQTPARLRPGASIATA